MHTSSLYGGASVSDYVKIVRVEEAKKLLSTSDKSVGEIAEQLRFCTGSYFARVFSDVVGMPPKEYREKTRP